MIEKTVLDFLSDALTEPVYVEDPGDATTFVIVEKTGSRLGNHIFGATIAVQSYGNSLFAAAEINEKVKTAMLSMASQDNAICKVSLNSDYQFTDLVKKRYRYQAVFDIVHY